MDENNNQNQQYGSYDPNQGVPGLGTSEYGYSPQYQQPGSDYTVSYDSQYTGGQGYDPYGYPGTGGTNYDQGMNTMPQQPGQMYDYSNQQYDQASQYNTAQGVAPSPVLPSQSFPQSQPKTKKDSTEKVKFLLFLIPVIVAVLAIVALVMEMGVFGANSPKLSTLFGIQKPSNNGNGSVAVSGYDECKSSGGTANENVFPAKCEKNNITYYKSYTKEQKEAAMVTVEKTEAQAGKVVLAPQREDEFKRNIKLKSKTGSADGVINYVYTNEKGDTYQMFINNKYLRSTDGKNEILVDKVVKFIETGKDYDGSESLISKAFGDTIVYTISLGELTVDYPGVDKMRALYAVDGDYLAGELKVKLFAQKRDNVFLLEKVISPNEYLEAKSSYLKDCMSSESEPGKQQTCYLEFLADDKDIKAAAEKDLKDLVSIFTLGD